jgi:hypothetical protein
MTSTPNKPNWTLAIGLPVLVMTSCTIIVFSPVYLLNASRFSTAITLDLTLTAPLLYLLVIRGTPVPKMTAVRVFFAGLLLAGLLLHDKPHLLLSLLKTWVAPLAEAILLFIIARKFHHASRSVKTPGEEGGDFLYRCRIILAEVTGSEKAGNILASEMAVLYYVFVPRRMQMKGYAPMNHGTAVKNGVPVSGCNPVNGQAAFTSYKTNGILLVLGVLLCCFFVETAGLHLLLGLWSKKLAWVLTTLGLYTAFQLYAHMRAVKSRPIVVGDQFLQLRNGLAGDACVRMDNIEHITFDGRKIGGHASAKEASLGSEKETVKLALLKGLENHNILLTLKEPIWVSRPFGIRQKATTLLFFVDRPAGFLSAVQEKLKG